MTGTDDAALGRLCKRSITVAGHRTSVSLEEIFWRALAEQAAAEGRSLAKLIAEVDRHRAGNLSSALRVHAAVWLRDRETPG